MQFVVYRARTHTHTHTTPFLYTMTLVMTHFVCQSRHLPQFVLVHEIFFVNVSGTACCVGSVCVDVVAVDTCSVVGVCRPVHVRTPAHQQKVVHCTKVQGLTKVVAGSGCVLEAELQANDTHSCRRACWL